MSNSKPDWLADIEAADKRDRDRLPAAKAVLLAALKKTRAALVTVEYDGEGDSGQITGIGAVTALAKPAKLPKGPFSLQLCDADSSYVSIEEVLDAFAWAVLRAYHGGFENNEGGFGTLTIDVAKGTITLDHNDRIIDVSNTLTEV
jgi:hypothetical protein